MSRSLQTVSRDRLYLTADEEKLFECLDKFVAHLKATKTANSSLEARIAGGWVRDKLLRQECYDCDVAVAEMKGLDFALRFVPFYQQYFDMPAEKIRVAEIKANPDQSKHLDTATVSLLGQGGDHKKMDLDFVQLRSEEYGESSRIPTEVKFGTPLEDALRRDLTINALFYNVHTQQVEDHTEQGLVDLLEVPLIRTPLEPRQTFLDDPLRILRCIRFAVRLGFPLHDNIRAAVQEPEVMNALATKVSRERVGIEVKKMLSSKGAAKAIKLIVELGLYEIVFGPTTATSDDAEPDTFLAVKSTELVRGLVQGADAFVRLPPSLVENVRDSLELYLAGAIVPYRGRTYGMKKGKIGSVPRLIAAESLKLGNDEADYVDKLLQNGSVLNRHTLRGFSGHEEAADLGFLLTRISAEKGPDWRASIFFCLLLDLLKATDAEGSDTVALYAGLVERILALNLDKRAFAKPILSGNDAKGEGIPPLQIKAWLEQVKRWQLLHPDGGRDECLAHMRTALLANGDQREAKKPRR